MSRVKSAVLAALGVLAAVVFFPLWLAVPVAVLAGGWGLSLAALGSSVRLDQAAGLLVLRVGPIVRRIRIIDVAAVMVEGPKVSLARARGGEISLYAWAKGPLDARLGVPVVAGDIGHAIASAVALAQADQEATDQEAADPEVARAAQRSAAGGRTPAGQRSRLATALLGVAGLIGVVGALFVRVHWSDPALTVLGVILALALGVTGLLNLLAACWILLTGRSPRARLTR